MSSTKSKTTHILTLDGGGVRGLSSLIILKRLMKHVNEQMGLPQDGLTPRDLFSLVAGTSTGGLIALIVMPCQERHAMPRAPPGRRFATHRVDKLRRRAEVSPSSASSLSVRCTAEVI